MANTIGPFGFSQWGTASGPPNFAENHNTPYRISSANGTAIFYGDAVRMATGNTGFIVQWTAAGGSANEPLVGIFVGCSYFSTARQFTVFSRYWPGSDATGDVNAFVVDDPNSQWLVQADTTVVAAITQTAIGQTADVVVNAGNTVTGISGMALALPTSTSTFPFKVVNVLTTPPGANGTDLTTKGNYVIVAFNNQAYKQLGGVT